MTDGAQRQRPAADCVGMSDNQPPSVDPYAETEPGPPDDARDPVRDIALLLREFLVLGGQMPMPEPREGVS